MNDQAVFDKGIRVASDGTVTGTRIYDGETGDDLTGKLRIRSVKIEHVAGGTPMVTLECFPSEIDVTALANDSVRLVPVVI